MTKIISFYNLIGVLCKMDAEKNNFTSSEEGKQNLVSNTDKFVKFTIDFNCKCRKPDSRIMKTYYINLCLIKFIKNLMVFQYKIFFNRRGGGGDFLVGGMIS